MPGKCNCRAFLFSFTILTNDGDDARVHQVS